MPPVEPSADIRGMASFCRQLFVALREQQFTEDQALLIIGRTVQGAAERVESAESPGSSTV